MRLIAICAACLLLIAGVDARAASAEMNAEVPAKKWKALRLRGLTKGALVAVRVETSGPIAVIFVHQEELKRFPEQPVRPIFAGAVERRLSFSVKLPAAGSYYVILDNRKGTADHDVRVQIQARRARKPAPKPPAPHRREQDAKAI
jgi:hypothetical protein